VITAEGLDNFLVGMNLKQLPQGMTAFLGKRAPVFNRSKQGAPAATSRVGSN
jgi:hypothetical protein